MTAPRMNLPYKVDTYLGVGLMTPVIVVRIQDKHQNTVHTIHATTKRELVSAHEAANKWILKAIMLESLLEESE